MVLIFPFFLQKQLRHSQQQQGARVVFKSKTTTQHWDVDLNKTALFAGFPVNAVKFTFWWDWKPLQSRVREYDLAKPCHRLSRLNMGLLDCAINERSVDGGRDICHLFCPSAGDFTAQESPPPGICHLRQKIANARGQPGETGRSWNWQMYQREKKPQRILCCS